MKRWLLYGAAIALLGLSPLQGVDLGKLIPVETVWLSEQNGQVYILTDAGDEGVGTDVQTALNNLQDTASGIVFLETADYVIVETGGEELLEQLHSVLRPSSMICTADKQPELEEATEFLGAHEPHLTLRQWRVERSALPQLQGEKGRFHWDDG